MKITEVAQIFVTFWVSFFTNLSGRSEITTKYIRVVRQAASYVF
jgi:hypothetical protein